MVQGSQCNRFETSRLGDFGRCSYADKEPARTSAFTHSQPTERKPIYSGQRTNPHHTHNPDYGILESAAKRTRYRLQRNGPIRRPDRGRNRSSSTAKHQLSESAIQSGNCTRATSRRPKQNNPTGIARHFEQSRRPNPINHGATPPERIHLKFRFLQFNAIGSSVSQSTRTKLDVFLNQIVDSAIVGGIAGLSILATGGSDFRAALIAFGLTFLIKLKDYRGLTTE